MKQLNKILLVDDDATSNFLTRMLIEDMELANRIYTAQNGAEALELIKGQCISSEQVDDNYCPELILLDINMPIMDGFEFLEELQKLKDLRHKDTKIVILTSSTNAKDLERAQSYAVYKYLQKPLTEEKLLTIRGDS
jgi:CheY-like chemotaxis protein